MPKRYPGVKRGALGPAKFNGHDAHAHSGRTVCQVHFTLCQLMVKNTSKKDKKSNFMRQIVVERFFIEEIGGGALCMGKYTSCFTCYAQLRGLV